MALQTCHEKKKSSGLISLQLDPLIWETASPRTNKPKIVSESLMSISFLKQMTSSIIVTNKVTYLL